MQRFLKVFGPLAILVGAMKIIDAFWGLLDDGTLRAMRPIIPGSFFVIVGVFMVREARAASVRARETGARPNGEL